MAEKRPPQPIGEHEVPVGDPDRCVGSFAGWSSANDFWVGAGNGIMHCCTGNGARALYYIWENMIDFREGELHLHLLLNRDSAWAEVASYIPHQGRVDLKLKQECARLLIRAPEWIETWDFGHILYPQRRTAQFGLGGPLCRGGGCLAGRYYPIRLSNSPKNCRGDNRRGRLYA